MMLWYESNQRPTGDNPKAWFYKYHMIELFFKVRCYVAYISVSLSFTWSHKTYELKWTEMCTEYLTDNLSLCW